MSRHYTSAQAAKRLGVPTTTLSTYITAGKIPKPKSLTSGEMTIYLWTDQDIERVRKLLPKITNGRKTRYKKKKKPQARAPVPNKKKK